MRTKWVPIIFSVCMLLSCAERRMSPSELLFLSTEEYDESKYEEKITKAGDALKIEILGKNKIKLNGIEVVGTNNGLLFKPGDSDIYPNVSLRFPSDMYVTYKGYPGSMLIDNKRMIINVTSKSSNQIETERGYLPGKYAFPKFVADGYGGNEKVPKCDMTRFEGLSFTIIIKLDKEYEFDDCLEAKCNHNECKAYRFMRRSLLLGRLYDF